MIIIIQRFNIQLQVELHKLGIYATGTVRPNRLSSLMMKKDKDLFREGRRAMDYRVTKVGDVQICVKIIIENIEWPLKAKRE